MTVSRFFKWVLNLLIACALAAAAYVWLVGPIETEARARAIHWSDPLRPLKLAAALLILRVAIPWIGRAAKRSRAPALAAARRPYVWATLLVLLVAAWPYARHRAYRSAVRAADQMRESGHAQIGLASRPVLTLIEMLEGIEIPPGVAGRGLEIACGLAPHAAPYFHEEGAGVKGRLLLSDPAGSHQILAECAAKQGGWATATATLPAVLQPGARLLTEVETRGTPKGADRFLYWSRPSLLPASDPSRPNLILISLDTLRADHLGAYGYARPTSPNMDRLAREGTLFERAISQSPWTTPSHMSLFTSLFPSVHGVDAPTTIRQRRLAEGRKLLAEVLRDSGYVTAAFTGSGSISALYGFWRGFDVYDETDKDDPARRGEDISGVFDKASRWLVAHRDMPFFLFFHSYEVHAPFVHEAFLDEAGGAGETRRLEALYDGDILYADAFVGQLLALVEGLGIRQRTIVVLLSDHGEELVPRYPGKRFGHGHTVYDDLLRVPLIISAPGRVPSGLRLSEMVQTIDVMPTLLELMGVPAPPESQGRSLAAAFRGEPIRPRHALAEATNYGPERKAIRESRYKYIRVFPRDDKAAREIPADIPQEELFDLVADPEERRSILGAGGDHLARLRKELQALVDLNLSLRGAVPEQSLDAETIRRLKALGYIQ